MLGELILGHSDNTSYTLQYKSISAAEGQQVASMMIQPSDLCNDESYDMFWKSVDLKVKSLVLVNQEGRKHQNDMRLVH